MEAWSLNLWIFRWEEYIGLPSIAQKMKKDKNYKIWRVLIWLLAKDQQRHLGNPDLPVPCHVSPTAVLKLSIVCYYLLSLSCPINELYLVMSHFACSLKFPTSVLLKRCMPVWMHHQTWLNFSPSASALWNHLLFHVYLAGGKRGQDSSTHFLTSQRHWKSLTVLKELKDTQTYSLPDPGLSEERSFQSSG